MGTGRFFPGFERYGGGTPTLKTILDALNASRGTAYDTTEDGIVYAENEAIARMLWIAWEQNQRLANQFDPSRLTDFLPRWEKIFGITPTSEQTESERRAVVVDRWSRIGITPTRQELTDRLTAALGPVFVSIEEVDLANAIQWVPTATPAWPAGPPPATRNVAAVGASPQWYSTTAHVRIKVQQPSSMSTGEFWTKVGKAQSIMDPMLPAWVTWDWYVVSDTGAGFWLDESTVAGRANNLDHHTFD